MTETTEPLLCDNEDVMGSLLAALSDPGHFVDRAPLESWVSWQRRAVIEHAAPHILAASADSDTAAVPAGELVSFGAAMDGAQKALAALAAENEHLRSALAGDNEGVRLWMLDCGNLVAKHRERADRAEAALAAVSEHILIRAESRKTTLTWPENGDLVQYGEMDAVPAGWGEMEVVPLTALRSLLAPGASVSAFWLDVTEDGEIAMSAPCAGTLGCLWGATFDGERVTLGELLASAATHTGIAAGKLHAGLSVIGAYGTEAAEVNNGRPVAYSSAAAPGGWVCAVPVAGNPDDICGNPVESEPCTEHPGGGGNG